MSIFRDILRKIFPSDHPALAQNVPTDKASDAAVSTTSGPTAAAVAASGAVAGPNAAGSNPAIHDSPVDVESVLNDLARKSPEKLNWRTSIVDLMKLVGMDSSLPARKALAQELHYTGDTTDSAGMNIWLHKEVMKRIAENGGKVPDELKH